eukprot:scaffold4229_cov30-Tisochrysis_lutea.AAC.13
MGLGGENARVCVRIRHAAIRRMSESFPRSAFTCGFWGIERLHERAETLAQIGQVLSFSNGSNLCQNGTGCGPGVRWGAAGRSCVKKRRIEKV